MITPQTAHQLVSIAFHMWILFVFLTTFFYLFISKTEQKVINDELSNIIQTEIPIILKQLDNLGGNNIQWDQVDKIAQQIKDKYKGKDQKIAAHNKKILNIAISICVIGFMIILSSIIYFTVYLKYDIGLKEILFENIIVTILVGSFEALFFLNISFKYSLLKPSQLTSNIIDRLKYQLNKQL